MTETSPETLFPPKPGGMVDTARQRMAAEADQLAALAETPAARARRKSQIPVKETGTELARARTFSVATGTNNPVEILGADPNRRSAVIMTLDEPVVISFSEQAAQDSRNADNAAGLSANGFVLPVNVAVPVNATAVVWCTATSSTATRVSVMAFSYDGA